ncbi:MAG: CoA transferase [Chloroflexi bacterium]|nr:CoA transferase [Chloroflexota bacterium]
MAARGNGSQARGPGLFDNVRVVDLTHNLNGPYATKLMADLGAEVIKIEEQGLGDFGRGLDHNTPGMGGYFMWRNPGKKSISADLKTPRGLRLVKELVAVADVFIENRKAGAMKHLGLDYESLCKVKPDIIMCSSSGFGQYGPLSHLPGGDLIIQAYSGSLWITGPREAPMPPWAPWIDFATGTHAFGAVAAALYRRALTGEGECIDVSMLDCAFNYHDFPVEEYVLSGGKVERTRQGQNHPKLVPLGVWKVQDGAVVVSAARENSWRNLCELIGREEWSGWTEMDTRTEHIVEINQAIADFLAPLTQAEATTLLEQAGVLGPPILTIADICNHPHVKERELLVDVPHPITGEPVKVQSTPVKFRNSFARARGAAPLLGQHTDELLSELLGYSAAALESLWGEGVLYAEPAARRPGRAVKEVAAVRRPATGANWSKEAKTLKQLAGAKKPGA